MFIQNRNVCHKTVQKIFFDSHGQLPIQIVFYLNEGSIQIIYSIDNKFIELKKKFDPTNPCMICVFNCEDVHCLITIGHYDDVRRLGYICGKEYKYDKYDLQSIIFRKKKDKIAIALSAEPSSAVTPCLRIYVDLGLPGEQSICNFRDLFCFGFMFFPCHTYLKFLEDHYRPQCEVVNV